MNRFPQTFFSLGKTINIIFMYLLAPLIVQDLKKKIIYQMESYKYA